MNAASQEKRSILDQKRMCRIAIILLKYALQKAAYFVSVP